MGTARTRRWGTGVALVLATLLLLAWCLIWLYLRASLPQLDGVRQAAGLAGVVTVARDARGVPLLTAASRADLAYATGFLHAQERFFQMDLMRRAGAGELAELFGARALAPDRSHRLHRFRARAEAMLARMPADDRAFLERYVAGVNDGLGALTARPFEYALLGAAPRPWQAADSLLVGWAMYFDLQGMQEPRKLARGWVADHTDAAQRAFLLPAASAFDAPLDAESVALPPMPLPPTAPAWWGAGALPAPSAAGGAGALRSAMGAMPGDGDGTAAVGSNNWVLAGSRSASGRAIVSNDMHLGLQLPVTWYRLAMQFVDAGGQPRRLAGLTLPGAPPLLTVGSNGRVAWGYTNAYGDFLDLVEVAVDPADASRVRAASRSLQVVVTLETIVVKGAPAERLAVRETDLGPLRSIDGRTYAVHWIAHHPAALNLRLRQLESADTLAQALQVAAGVGVPAQNFVAGDAAGHIGWTITGPLPRRAPAAPGALRDASFPLLHDGAATSWDGVLAPSDYPALSDPAGGQLSTANSRQLAGPQAALIGDGGFDLGARNGQARDALRALGAGADVASVYGVMLDDRAVFAERWRRRALALLDSAAIEGHPLRAEFARLLRDSWSGHASVDSSGYRLARGFMWALHEQAYGRANAALAAIDPRADMHGASARWPAVMERLLDEQPPGWLPAGYGSWRAFELAAVDRLAARLTADGAPLAAATWGRRNTAAIAHPITVALPILRPWLAAPPDQLPGDAHMPRVAGSKFGQSERMTVSPGLEEQGVFNMPGGQSGHPLSPYFMADHADWLAGRPGPLLPGPAVHRLRLEPAAGRIARAPMPSARAPYLTLSRKGSDVP
ncbi:penicillin acylase family protein [Massilia sp. DWR3-1-1]|uniref:penicillin acylase family protein n=1 Tax=Massilia sp. DWR3-1-1 TaxID=2804559 RepID=UPI003CF20EF9